MIRQAISFVAVVKAGSFSIAAKNLGVSKAQLSRHISQLEVSLGIQLLHRTTRSLALTDAGEPFFQQCLAIEEAYAEAVDALKQDFQALRGTLRITATISFGAEFLPYIIHQFTQRYPNIRVIVSLSSVTEDLIEKNFDLAIRIASKLPDSNLRMRTLMEFSSVLCAAPSYFQTQKIPFNLSELKTHRCITSVNRNTTLKNIQWSFKVNDEIIKFNPNNVIEIDSLRAQIKFALLGAGIAKIPKIFITKELQCGSLIEVLPSLQQPLMFAYLLCPNQKILPKKTSVFIDFLKEKIADEALFLESSSASV